MENPGAGQAPCLRRNWQFFPQSWGSARPLPGPLRVSPRSVPPLLLQEGGAARSPQLPLGALQQEGGTLGAGGQGGIPR